MLSKILSDQIYLGDFGWHTGRFHFSFDDYDNPENVHFGDLIAFNDFELKPGSGFETHSHSEIEIISYCVKGELTHENSMGNKNMIKRGDMPRCAGVAIVEFARRCTAYERMLARAKSKPTVKKPPRGGKPRTAR